MRLCFPFALLAATPLFAEDFRTGSTVTAVTVYPSITQETHQIAQQMPAGEHRLFFPANPDFDELPNIRSLTQGVIISQIRLLDGDLIDVDAYLSPEQEAAQQRLEQAEDALAAYGRKVSAITDRINALTLKLEFLKSLHAPDAKATPEELIKLSDLVLTGSEEVYAEIAAQKLKLETEQANKEKLDLALYAARAALGQIRPPQQGSALWSLTVNLQTAAEAVFELETLHGNAFWMPLYDIHLDREATTVTLQRKVGIRTSQEVSWSDVMLTLATNEPTDQIGPRPAKGNRASVFGVNRKGSGASSDYYSSDKSVATGEVEEAVVIVESIEQGFSFDTEGYAPTYSFPEKVSVGPSDMLVLNLGEIELAAQTKIWASPRWDDTAFLMAKVQNTTQEPLLPGQALYFRDGQLVGASAFEAALPSEKMTLPFGPVEHLRLDYIVKDNQTGDRGFINTETTRDHTAIVRVENLSDMEESVRVFFPFTYSEQDELDVSVRAAPAPNETDHDDQKGVSVWDLDIAAGKTAEINIQTELDWPAGQVLDWRP